ncbi:Phospholipase_B [Hexamita inflata]|uniref:Phospholipase B-like n=1 Tax=Hexamita inflata TaxID=28002 RepID=A0AA86V1C4_9EUKA|nr:Phospholipase B [Hexamita inflata]
MLLFISSLLKDAQPVFQRVCVYNSPLLRLELDCKVQEFTNEISAFINVSLELNKTGWMFFGAESNPDLTPKQQMRALGYAEGVLFHEHIANHQANLKDWFLFAYLQPLSDYPDEVYQFYVDNLAWTRQMSQTNRDAYWKQVAYTMAHFDGLVQGYQQKANDSAYMSELDLFMYMSSGDLLDVVEFAVPETRHKFSQPEYAELHDHCSGLVRITDDEVFLSQTAWFTYGSMTRVSKEYKYNIGARAKEVKFSSYPGFSYSFDDWYQTDSGMMWFETTNSIYEHKIYELCSTESVMTWIRAPLAGRMAEDAEHFSVLISKYNSGTYNNQWVSLDLKKFDAKATENVLWVMEQIPGKSASYDATDRLLKDGFFPSYNIPSQRELRIVSGYPAQEAKNVSLSYDKAARGQIFKRDAPKIENIEQMKEMMRYNDYMHDPLALDEKNNPEPANAISSRYDLRNVEHNANIKCFGGFDNKIGQYNRETQAYTSHMISSPANKDVPAWVFPDPKVLYCPRRGLEDGPYIHEWVQADMKRAW